MTPLARKRIVLAACAVVAIVVVALGGRAAYDVAHGRRPFTRPRVDPATCPGAIALGPACGPCVATFCCAAMNACHARLDCIDLNDCWVSCGGDEALRGVPREACPAACEARSPKATTLFHAWDDCVRAHCEEECPRGPNDEEEEEERRRR